MQFTGRERRVGIATALFLFNRPNAPVGFFQSRPNLFRIFGVADFYLFFTLAQETGLEPRRLWPRQRRIDRPIFFLFKRPNFPFAVNNQPQRNRLHTPGGNSATNLIPQQRRNLVTDQPIQNASRLLRINQIAIDFARMLERFLHGTLRNFVEGNALNGRAFLLLLGFLPAKQIPAQLLRQMRSNRLTFAIRVRRQVDVVHAQRHLFQLGQDFLFAGNDDVFGLEIVLDIDTQRALGQIFDVTERSLNLEAFAQIFLNGLRLRWRFDND